MKRSNDHIIYEELVMNYDDPLQAKPTIRGEQLRTYYSTLRQPSTIQSNVNNNILIDQFYTLLDYVSLTLTNTSEETREISLPFKSLCS